MFPELYQSAKMHPIPKTQLIFIATTTCLSIMLLLSLGSFVSTSLQKVDLKPAFSGSLQSSEMSKTDMKNLLPIPQIKETVDDPIHHIMNSTLGFQKIYAISLAHRNDKRDYMTLMALVSGLNIDFVDGINGSEISAQSLPSVSDFSFLSHQN
jgi:hypothetical protein